KEVLVSDVVHGRGELHWCDASLSVSGQQLERYDNIEQDVAVRRLGLHQVVVDRVASNGVIGEVTGVDSVDGQGTVGVGDPAVLAVDGNLFTGLLNFIHSLQVRACGSVQCELCALQCGVTVVRVNLVDDGLTVIGLHTRSRVFRVRVIARLLRSVTRDIRRGDRATATTVVGQLTHEVERNAVSIRHRFDNGFHSHMQGIRADVILYASIVEYVFNVIDIAWSGLHRWT